LEVSGTLHTSTALPPEPTGYEVGKVPEPVWARWRREKIPTLAGNRFPVAQNAAQLLYRTGYPGLRSLPQSCASYSFSALKAKFSKNFPAKTVRISHPNYNPSPSQPPEFHYSNYIWWPL